MNQPDFLEVNAKCISMSLDKLSAEERDIILPYLRGLETVAACRPKMVLSADVIDLEDYHRTRRLQQAVMEQRRATLAASRKIHRQQDRRLVVDEYGWVDYDGE